MGPLLLSALLSAASILALAPVCKASEADVNEAVNRLAPAFLAQNLTNVCAARNPKFTMEVSGLKGDPNYYVAYVRREATLPLSRLDAQTAVNNAALAARNMALQEIRARKDASAEREGANIDGWCETRAKPFVKHFIEQYDAEQK